jgi:hypothetical protein
VIVGTWNLENFFRPGADAGPSDEQAYDAKLTELARVIGEIGPDILAVQEVGDPEALEDLHGRLDGDWVAESSGLATGAGFGSASSHASRSGTSSRYQPSGAGSGCHARSVTFDVEPSAHSLGGHGRSKSCRGAPPRDGTVITVSSTKKAIRRPSGDHVGDSIPREVR